MRLRAGGQHRQVVEQDAVTAFGGGIARAIRCAWMFRPGHVLRAGGIHTRHCAAHGHDPGNGRHHDNKCHGQHRQPGNIVTRHLSPKHYHPHAWARLCPVRSASYRLRTHKCCDVAAHRTDRAIFARSHSGCYRTSRGNPLPDSCTTPLPTLRDRVR